MKEKTLEVRDGAMDLNIKFSSIEELLWKIKPVVEELIRRNKKDRACVIAIRTEDKLFSLVRGSALNQGIALAEVAEEDPQLREAIGLVVKSDYQR